MSSNRGTGELSFDCIVERPRAARFGGPYAVILALCLLAIALAAAHPPGRGTIPSAGTPEIVQVG